MLFEINGSRHVPLRGDAVVFSVAAEAHPPRQFEVQVRLRAKVMRVLHAPAPEMFVFDLGEQDVARLPLLTLVMASGAGQGMRCRLARLLRPCLQANAVRSVRFPT